MEAQAPLGAGGVDAIEHQGVEVEVQIERVPEALHPEPSARALEEHRNGCAAQGGRKGAAAVTGGRVSNVCASQDCGTTVRST